MTNYEIKIYNNGKRKKCDECRIGFVKWEVFFAKLRFQYLCNGCKNILEQALQRTI